MVEGKVESTSCPVVGTPEVMEPVRAQGRSAEPRAEYAWRGGGKGLAWGQLGGRVFTNGVDRLQEIKLVRTAKKTVEKFLRRPPFWL
jgi:hypothetical protein